MPIDPEKNMDELLKSYAQQRRRDAGAPLEMDGATRRLLQSEVARIHSPQPQPAARFGWLASFWPRLAVSGAALGLLAVLSLVWFRMDPNPSSQFELAQNLDPQRQRQAPEPLTLSNPTPKSSPSAASSDRVSPQNPVPISPTEMVPAAASAPAPVLTGEDNRRLVKRFAADPPAPATMPAAQPRLQPTSTSSRELPPAPAPSRPGAESELRRYGLTAERAPSRVQSNPSQVVSLSVVESAEGTRSQNEELTLNPTPSRRAAPENASLSASAPTAPPTSTPTPLAMAPAPTAGLPANASDMPAKPMTSPETPALAIVANDLSSNVANGFANNSTRQFTQIDSRARFRQNFNSPPVANVLQSFQIQREGSNVLVIDADGSIYNGSVQLAPAVASGPLAGPPTAPPTATRARKTTEARIAGTVASDSYAATPNPAQELDSEAFFFQAVGTNRSLQQRVVFTGNYLTTPTPLIANTPAESEAIAPTLSAGARFGSPSATSSASNSLAERPNVRQGGAAGSPPGVRGGSVAPGAGPFLQNQNSVFANGRIEGRAVIGSKNEVKIEANQVGP